jgi:hypothetical protein
MPKPFHEGTAQMIQEQPESKQVIKKGRGRLTISFFKLS